MALIIIYPDLLYVLAESNFIISFALGERYFEYRNYFHLSDNKEATLATSTLNLNLRSMRECY